MTPVGLSTADLGLLIANGVVAAAAILALVISAKSARSSNQAAKAAEAQAQAASEAAEVARQELQLAAQQIALGETQVEHARAAMAASFRPLIVDVPYGTFYRPALPGRSVSLFDDRAWIMCHSSKGEITIDLPLRNIGAGPAFIKAARLAAGSLVVVGDTTGLVVPPNELFTVNVTIQPDSPGFSTWLQSLPHAAFEAFVEYTDLGGQQPTQTVVKLHRESEKDPGARVTRVAIHRLEADGSRNVQPIAETSNEVRHLS